jgi:hypothetical protein
MQEVVMNLRKKFYFVDYTEVMRITERVFRILINKTNKGQKDYIIADIIKSLRWGRGVFNNKRSIKSISEKTLTIAKSLDILNHVKLINIENSVFTDNENAHDPIYNFTEGNKNDQLSLRFKVTSIQPNIVFHDAITSSAFSPIEGKKQILTKNMLTKFHKELKIDYKECLSRIKDENILNYRENMKLLSTFLEPKWRLSYQKACSIPVGKNITAHKHINFFALFDNAYDRPENNSIFSDYFIEDRTVCCYGFSIEQRKNRKTNDYYMKYNEARKWSDKKTDRGHFIAHSIGGDIFTNIFPQKRDINRGTSEKGKIYREMEKYLKNNIGVFCFARPIYFDFSTRPFILEFGYITKDYHIKVEYFDNV